MLYSQVFKTYEGARKRAAFENALAKGEYNQGYKARHYRYTIVTERDDAGNDVYRVSRAVAS